MHGLETMTVQTYEECFGRSEKMSIGHRRRSPAYRTSCSSQACRFAVLLFLISPLVVATAAESLHLHPRDTTLPLRVTNNCNEAIWPAFLTQGGTGPASSGFMLAPGDTNPQTVSGDWRGRVWARTNCSFPSSGQEPASGQGGAPCTTGDCGMFLECQGAVSIRSRRRYRLANILLTHAAGSSTSDTGRVHHVLGHVSDLL